MPAGRLKLALLLLVFFAVLNVHAQPSGMGPGDISQPPEIRQLRKNYDEKTETLRDRAAALRASANDPVTRAWATLALAEFENELEHEKETFELLDELEQSARALKVPDLEFAAQTLINVINVNRGRPQKTEAALVRMQQLADISGNLVWRAQIAHDRGVLFRKLGRFDDALKQFEVAEKINREIPGQPELAHELNSIGMLHGRTGRFSDAALVHKEALEIARKNDDRPEMARSLRLLGVLYRNLDDEEQGSEYLREALTHIQERNRREAIILNAEIGISLMKLERFDEAEAFIEKAVAMAAVSGNSPNKLNAYSRMAELELARGKWSEAKRWVDRAFMEFDKVAVRDQVLLRLTRVRIWAAKEPTPEALAEARITLEGTRQIGDRILERAALDVVADLELGLGDAASAYATRKAHQQLDKILAMDMAGRRIAVLEASLEKERADMERNLLERDSQIKDLRIVRQRYLGLALIAGIFALVAGLSLLFWRVRTMRQKNAELKASRDQLSELHFALLGSTEQLERMANSDALTSIANRHAVMRRLELTWQRATVVSTACLLLIDLDHFKQVNDRHGHLGGDAVLKAAAQRMQAMLPESTMLGRWGGEEFILVMEATDQGRALDFADRLRRQIGDTPVPWQGGEISVSASVGVSMLDKSRLASVDEWIASADRALYRAKREGRNRVELARQSELA
jgi:diguanylate cyclase (GGDEF)-like protein